MKYKAISVILFIFIISCTHQESIIVKKNNIKDNSNIERLKDFFNKVEVDALKAAHVVEKYRLIPHLTHLKKMDSGGKKFYLLEKFHITEMINSVTQSIYYDYFLINKNGEIIYTNNNDKLFGISINNGFFYEPLKKCFANANRIYFEDVSPISEELARYSLYVSIPVVESGNFHGILVMQIEVSMISKLLDANTEITNSEGIIKIATDSGRLFLKHAAYNSRDNSILLKDQQSSYIEKQPFIYSVFNFKDIAWVIITKNI